MTNFNTQSIDPIYSREDLWIMHFLQEHLRYQVLLRWTVAFYSSLILFFIFKAQNLEVMIGSTVITVFSGIPLILWLRAKHKGLPIFQIFSLSFLWCYALPLIWQHSSIQEYEPAEQLGAALMIALFMLVALVSWAIVFFRESTAPEACRSLPASRKDELSLFFLFCAVLYNFVLLSQIVSIPGEINSILRALVGAASLAGIFLLAYQTGAKSLSAFNTLLFYILLLSLCYLEALGLILNRPVITMLTALCGMALGKRSIPFIHALLGLSLFIFLHYGKYEMRSRYWTDELQYAPISLADMGSRLVEWYALSYENLIASNPNLAPAGPSFDDNQEDNSISFLNRVSLIHMFLRAYVHAGNDVEFLGIDPYASIPLALVPRILYPDKPFTHHGTFLLSVHYGLQTEEQVLGTTIGWGLLAEAWAAGGIFALVLLGIFLGVTLAGVGRLAQHVPVFSLRTFISLSFVAVVFHSEATMGVASAVLFQSTVVLIAVSLVFMRRYELDKTYPE